GINLANPTQNVQVAPGTFAPGPRVDVTTTAQGGKTVTVDVLRKGASAVSEIEILTVRGNPSSTFTLSWNGTSTSALSANISEADLATAINGITGNGLVASNPVVVQNQPEGRVYWITFQPGTQSHKLEFDGSLLQTRDE